MKRATLRAYRRRQLQALDRRRHRRRALAVPLVVAPLIPSGQGPQVGVRTPSATVNLSAGGLLVEGEVALPLQSMVRLELDLGDGHRPLLAHGQVIRLDLVGQRPVFGVSFVAIGKQDLSRLHRLLYRVGLAAKPAS